MYTCVHVHPCACGGRGQTSQLPQLPFLRYLSLLLFETESLTGLGPPIRLERLASEPQRSTCLPLPGADIVSAHHHAQLLSREFWGQIQVLPSPPQRLFYHVTEVNALGLKRTQQGHYTIIPFPKGKLSHRDVREPAWGVEVNDKTQAGF